MTDDMDLQVPQPALLDAIEAARDRSAELGRLYE